MVRKILVACSLALAALIPAVTAQARAQVIKQQSNKAGSVYITALALVPGHRYRIDVTSSPGHQKFTGQALENYIYVQNRALHTAQKPLTLNGTAPRSFSVPVQVSGKITQWLLTVEIQLKTPHSVTVRVVDLSHA